jgi:hypothetical protein
MMAALAVGDRVRVIIADGGDRRRRDHGEAVVIGEFRDYWLLQAKHYRFTVHKRAVACGDVLVKEVWRR